MFRERFVVTRGNDAPRFLFYSHDGLGLGGAHRAARNLLELAQMPVGAAAP